MTVCNHCQQPIHDQPQQAKDQTLCGACCTLPNDEPRINVRPLERNDLELVLAWRSHPKIYQYFRHQDEPLSWKEHISWFNSRPSNQWDFAIQYNGRRVGVVAISPEDEVTVYIGEFSAEGRGIATSVIKWLCTRFESRTPLTAEVNRHNNRSKNLFEKCGFQKKNLNGEWITYVYEP